jgi:hypothetical protein
VKQRRTLLDEIERDVLDHQAPLAAALRKCVALGGHARSGELRTWATRELSGYAPTDDDIPEYRTVPAPLKIDGSNLRFLVEGQQISPSQLPDFARGAVKEQVTLFQGVGELEALLENARSNGGFVRVSFPGASDLAAYMNSRADYGTAVHRIYHGVSAISVAGVLDRVRTTLTELVAELRDGQTDAEGVPSPEAAAQALNVAVHGRGHRVHIVSTQTGGHATTPAPPEKDPWWKRWQVLSALVGGAATLTGAGIALVRALGG